jgi:hypothetical protein
LARNKPEFYAARILETNQRNGKPFAQSARSADLNLILWLLILTARFRIVVDRPESRRRKFHIQDRQQLRGEFLLFRGSLPPSFQRGLEILDGSFALVLRGVDKSDHRPPRRITSKGVRGIRRLR